MAKETKDKSQETKGESRPKAKKSEKVLLKHRSVTAGTIKIVGISIPLTGVVVTKQKAEEAIAARTAQFERRAQQLGRKPDACDIFYTKLKEA